MLINMLRDEEPTHVVVAFDKARRSFRTEEYSEYKAGRARTPDEFQGQISLVKEILGALRITFVELDGYEADDIIATIATQAEGQDVDVLICSGDRDTFQLVSDRVTILYPVRGVSEVWRMGPTEVEEKYGVPPNRYSDLAAMVGETSDNLPGVPGVGPKTAAKWITQYGDLDGIVASIDKIPGKAGQSLRDHLDQVLRNRRLNQLVKDSPVGVGIDELRRTQWSREEVHTVFDGLEFRVLRDRLFATVEAAAPEAEEGFDVDGAVLTPESVPAWVAEHLVSDQRAGLSVTGTWARGTGDATGLALAAADGSAAWVDLQTLTPDREAAGGRGPGGPGGRPGRPLPPPAGGAGGAARQTLPPEGGAAVGGWLEDVTRPKAMHDAKGPIEALAARGWSLRGLTSDTQLAAYL